MAWKCNFTCTSLAGVLEVVRAGLAVSVVAIGDAANGVRIIEERNVLPTLPPTSLTIKYSEKEPSLATRALARTMADALASV